MSRKSTAWLPRNPRSWPRCDSCVHRSEARTNRTTLGGGGIATPLAWGEVICGSVYAERKIAIPENRPVPRHIAVIMDGNGRWAKKRGLPRRAGHEVARNLPHHCNLLQGYWRAVFYSVCLFNGKLETAAGGSERADELSPHLLRRKRQKPCFSAGWRCVCWAI